MIERVIIINLFSNAATTNQKPNMELFYENSFNGFRPFTTFALKLRLRCLIGSNTAILYIHLFINFYEQNLSVNFHGGAGIS